MQCISPIRWKKFAFVNKLVLVIPLLALLLPIFIIQYQVLQFTKGTFSYPLDDTFIHMAIAKNLAMHHVWGISPHEFASASSSIIYPLMVAAAFKLFGVIPAIPFIINLLAAIIFLVATQKWLQKQEIGFFEQLLILLIVVVLIPLPVIVIFGMEHTLHILFCFVFLYAFADSIEKRFNHNNAIGLSPKLYIYGLLIVAIRYESIFLVGSACLFLTLINRWREAIKLGFISLLPILIFGFWSLSKGSYFIPNSVLLKSAVPPLTLQGLTYFFSEGIFEKFYYMRQTPGTAAILWLLVLIPFTYSLFAAQIYQRAAYRYILIFLFIATFLQLTLTNIIWTPYRYEAYLLGCTIPILGLLVVKHGKVVIWKKEVGVRWATILLLLLLVLPSLLRSKKAFEMTTQACINIYEQQYQMGCFLQQYYNNTPVAIGDIGAVSYLSEGKKIDMEGLGNLSIASSRLNHYWSPQFASELLIKENTKIAIVYPQSYPYVMRHWIRVGSWQIPNNVVCYSPTVSFYAIDSTTALGLITYLRAFQKQLPRGVVSVYYILK